MARVAPLAPRPNVRIDPIPVAWGGLVAATGLMAGAGRDWPVRLALAALTFALGGFLSGVRAMARRRAHAVASAVAAYGFHAAFVVLTRVADALGGPDAPGIAPGGGRDWVVAAGWALAFALLGGQLANAWLSPPARR